jgi:hypothetical protein
MGTLDTDGLHNIYIEDCTFNNFGYGITINCGDGCRAVIRHNTFNDSLIGTHGQGSGPQFGCRHVEIYNNNFNYDGKVPMGSIWGCRGGTFVFYNNYVDPKHAATGYTTFSFCVDAITRAGELSCPYTYPIARQPGQGWNGATPAYADYNAWHAANPGWTPGNPTNGSYAWDQIGTTSDGAGNCPDPIYIWGNTGEEITMYFPDFGSGSGSDECYGATGRPPSLQTQNFVLQNRDYYLNAGAKPGYTPYTYPHPLRATVEGGLQLRSRP